MDNPKQYITDPAKVVRTKYFNLLCALYVSILLSAVTICTYVAVIRGFIFTEGAAITPLMYFFENIIAEVYGYSKSRNLIWIALTCNTVFVLIVIAMINLPSPTYYLHQQTEYREILGPMYRVLLANIIIMPISEFINVFTLSKCKIFLKGKVFGLRCVGSSALGELTLAIFGNLIVFGGTVPFHMVLKIILASFLMKLFFSMFAVFPAILITRWLKRAEGLDIYDYYTSFSPFKFEIQ